MGDDSISDRTNQDAVLMSELKASGKLHPRKRWGRRGDESPQRGGRSGHVWSRNNDASRPLVSSRWTSCNPFLGRTACPLFPTCSHSSYSSPFHSSNTIGSHNSRNRLVRTVYTAVQRSFHISTVLEPPGNGLKKMARFFIQVDF